MQNSHKIGSLTSSQWEALIDVLQRSRFDEKWNVKNGTWQLQYFDYGIKPFLLKDVSPL